MGLPQPLLEAAAERLEASGLAPEVRALDVSAHDERAWVHETMTRERWPRDGLTWTEWNACYAPTAAKLIDGSRGVIAIAHASAPVFLGFALADDQGLRMVFVKPAYRGCGIGVRLLSEVEVDYPVRVVSPNRCWRRWCESTGLETTGAKGGRGERFREVRT
jgi:GNAT superfamily N-acetyltransferase